MKKFIAFHFSLKQNTDFERTIETISNGVILRGYNLWILICSSILASIGLDTNSTAVIIGAMLISPLMSPILGVGLSLAIHDKQLLIRSLRNLLIAVVIGLGASVLYFFLSPLGNPTPELQARTFPTLLDVFIALFGGIAGIVSISRHDQTNAIPGVAIATALMPPLCTAGFGLATGNIHYFLGAFYLFLINAVFISLSTYFIVRYLKFPVKAFLTGTRKRQYQFWFLFLGMIAVAPSIYFLYSVYKDQLVKNDIQRLVINPVKMQGNEILRWEIMQKDSTTAIKVYHSGKPLSDSFKLATENALKANGLASYRFEPVRLNLTKEEIGKLSADMTRQVIEEMHLQEIRDSIFFAGKKTDTTVSATSLQKESRIAFPFIDSLAVGTILFKKPEGETDTIPVIYYLTAGAVKKPAYKIFYNYLLARLSADTVVMIRIK